ncbi:MAG: HlyD family efflux transporter periplasmic adaptor subunit [Eubacteriales bacterium]|nr:HlyD family efflux transporter periplasmic adaptor subunit [Eubacteriales bacterium]
MDKENVSRNDEAIENSGAQAEQIDREIKEIMSGETDSTKLKNPAEKKRKRGKRVKRVVIAAVVLLAGAAGYRAFAGGGTALPVVETKALSKGDITEYLTVTGPVEGTDSVDVTSSLHAKILTLPVREGDRVTAGETVLATLDTSALEKEVEAARGSYELAVAQRDEKVRSDTEGYQKALQALNSAQNEYNRQAALAQTGDVPQAELEKAADALSDARRTVSFYRVKNGEVLPDETMEIQIENAKLSLSQAEDKLKDAVITAPITGTVTRVNTKVGQFADDIEDSKPMITIENLDVLQMEIKVSEYSIGKVKQGQTARISADILGEGMSVTGEVSSISPTGEEKGGGSTERVIPTRITILDRNTALIAGITAKAQIELDKAEDVFVVPASAVGQDLSGQAAMQFAVPDETGTNTVIKIVPVTTGLESDTETEIRGAVNAADESLFTAGSSYLSVYDAMMPEGTAVTALEDGEFSDMASDAAEGNMAGEESEN